MKLRNLLLLTLVAVPVAASAQAPPKHATPAATLEHMRANVAKITEPAEKERWQANVTMWQAWIGDTATWELEDVARMRAAFSTMKANVAKIVETTERARWQYNCDLWQIALAAGPLSKADQERRDAVLERMKENVAGIAAPNERSRWQSNHELWMRLVGQD